MQHQVLARKWRPKTFEEMVGQEHVLKALINALDQDRLHHAYLFTGTRGVGKTTIARILAKCLNCEEGVSSKPCNQCSSCVEINEGRCVDLIEVDAASRTKVEDTRELLDNVQYAPTRARYKVYLIDEVHMLSTHSFNALLKTLEEPPPHIKFLLATTDPQKLPVTILSRCLQFNLKNMAPDRIVEHLKQVLAAENISSEESALWQLGRAADGSMRDALSLTDQAIAYGQGELKEEDISAMLGSIDRDRVFQLFDALVANDGLELLKQVADLSAFSPDYGAVLEELISLLHRIAVAQTVPEGLDNSFGDQEKIKALAAGITGEDLQLFYQIALMGRRDLPLNPDPRAGLEMVLLRMLAFKPDSAGEPTKKKLKDSQPDSSLQSSKQTSVTREKPVVTADSQANIRSSKAAQALAMVHSTPKPTQEARPRFDLVVNNRVSEQSAPPAPDESRQLQARHEEVPAEPEALKESREERSEESAEHTAGADNLEHNAQWIALVNRLDVRGMTLNILMQCVFKGQNEDAIELTIDPQYIDLVNGSHSDRIDEALRKHFKKPVKALIKAGGTGDTETPAANKQRIRNELLADAQKALEEDPNVQALIEKFDAVLDVESIEPLDKR